MGRWGSQCFVLLRKASKIGWEGGGLPRALAYLRETLSGDPAGLGKVLKAPRPWPLGMAF